MQLQVSLPAFMAWFVVRQRGADAARGMQQAMAQSSNTCTHACSARLLQNIPNSRLNDNQQEQQGQSACTAVLREGVSNSSIGNAHYGYERARTRGRRVLAGFTRTARRSCSGACSLQRASASTQQHKCACSSVSSLHRRLARHNRRRRAPAPAHAHAHGT